MKIKDLNQDLKDEIVRIVLAELKTSIRFYFDKDTVLTVGTVIKLLERTVGRLDHEIDLEDMSNYENY